MCMVLDLGGDITNFLILAVSIELPPSATQSQEQKFRVRSGNTIR